VNVLLEEEQRSPWIVVYSVLLATFIAPILEEIFFRGFCYPIFKKKWGKNAGMIITSSFFAIIHNNTFAFWPIFVLGMALAYMYEKRRSLIAPMTLHLIHNTIFIGYFFLAKQALVSV
jgi:membrane protease YdiL (CAAX protease family)